VFRRAMYVLECHTIQRDLRLRIIDLFEKAVLRRFVLEDSDEDNDDDNEEEEDDSSGSDDSSNA
jgi:hypothetical protein